MASANWWLGNPGERYWLESTDRADIGLDLRAPELDSKNEDNWRYSLFKSTIVGDLVFHYDKKRSAITSVSRIAGAWASREIVWAARGTSARERAAVPLRVPGYFVPLEDHISLENVISLDDLRLQRSVLEKIEKAIPRSKGKAAYFPFELSARPVRPLQGYAFKLPADMVRSFPAMQAAARQLLDLPGREKPEDLVRSAVSAIEREAKPYGISRLQQMRSHALGLSRTSRTIFGPGLKGPDWTFHLGGRGELQFNVGHDQLDNGGPAIRVGVAFSFQASRSFPKIDALLPKVARFNAWLRDHVEELGDLKMWFWQGLTRGPNVTPSPVTEASFKEGNFIFLGAVQPLAKFDPIAALQVLDRLLPLYEAVEFPSSKGANTIPAHGAGSLRDDILQIGKGREVVGGRWITASTKERLLNIYLRHAEVQRRLREALVEEGYCKILCEVPIGSRSVDLIGWLGEALWMFEIKTGPTVRSCLREALGQLLEYALWPGATKPDHVVVVGTPALDEKARRYIEELNRAFPVPLSYRQVPLD
ncbi:hypothetical protein AB4Z25_11705 [Rhizobium sp. RAF36]|uniref:hypothetical protein n=1 Tax=Rhizobium sp. RAF36 TaxID=3233055 RepID=UPI003F99257D